MNKRILIAVSMVAPLAATAVKAVSGCGAFGSSVTGSSGQAWSYLSCVGGSIAKAWDMFFEYF